MPIEIYRENASKLKQDQVSGSVSLFAPAFLTLEVTNALWKAVKLKRLSKEDSQKAVISLGNTIIELYEIEWPQAPEVLDIACNLDIAIYDAAYLFLSEKINAQLITSDTKLYEKAKARFRVLHLKDYI